MAKKKNNLLIYGLIGAVLILIAVAAYQAKNKEKGEKVQTEFSELRTIKETVEASGKVFPKTEVKISSDVSGELVELYVSEGDSVTDGQILARIDPEAYNSQVERASAGVNSAKAAAANSKAQIETFKAQKEQIDAQLSNAKDIHRRNEKLHKEGVISDQEFESSQSNMNSLMANMRAAEANINSAIESAKGAGFQIKSAEATLKEINTNLKRTTIYSTMNGIVSKLNVEKGERVVGTSMMAGTEILRVADLRVMEVQVEVTENDLPRISLEQSVNIEIDAYINRRFEGKVVEIAHTANNAVGDMGNGVVILTSDQVTNFVVTIDIDPSSYRDLISPKKPYPFRPGMSASVQIYTKTNEDIVTVPIQSVGTRDRDKDEKKGKAKQVRNADYDDEIKEIIFIVAGDTVEMREVKTGIQDDDYIEIISGLKEGVEVVIGPYAAVSRKLDGGDDVLVKNDEDEEEEEDN